nr:MAG TPA: hypothetical protein [Crassvirales sp.]
MLPLEVFMVRLDRNILFSHKLIQKLEDFLIVLKE